MSLKVVESQSGARSAESESAASDSVPWFAGGLVLLGVLAVARVLLGVAWGGRLASIGSPGPTLAGSLVAALLLVGAGLASRSLGGGRLAQLCAGLGVLASPVFWSLLEDWRFNGELTVGLGALRLDGPVSTGLWMVGWVPAMLAVVTGGLGLRWLRQGRRHAFTALAVIWLPLLLIGLVWVRSTATVIDGTLLVALAAWSWGAAVLSGLSAEVLLARAVSRSPLHGLMIAFLVQLVLTAAWVVIGFR